MDINITDLAELTVALTSTTDTPGEGGTVFFDDLCISFAAQGKKNVTVIAKTLLSLHTKFFFVWLSQLLAVQYQAPPHLQLHLIHHLLLVVSDLICMLNWPL